jgi:D-glycero-alpha-D-manno-heptose-7-phosphate kinase
VTRLIRSRAPIRLCDCGGWTDTWFARHGAVFNIAVSPYAEVQLRAETATPGAGRIVIHAENYGERYTLDRAARWQKHPLLEAAIASMRVPDDLSLEIAIRSDAPSGASTGTSAAITVALIAALDALTPGRLTPPEIAAAAHRVETDLLNQQSGIQDQLASACGGVSFIEMHAYPHATVTPLPVSAELAGALEQRLALIYLGRSHHSSQVHEMVIAALEAAGPECAPLNDLRACAARAREAVLAGDLAGLGRAMTANTEAQGRLHAALISAEAAQVIEIAKAHGAAGWKVNGAGGEGGSLTLLCGADSRANRAMLRAVEQASALFKNIPIRLSREGVKVWS